MKTRPTLDDIPEATNELQKYCCWRIRKLHEILPTAKTRDSVPLMFYLTARCSATIHVWQDMMTESGTRLLFSEYLHKVKTELPTLQVSMDH